MVYSRALASYVSALYESNSAMPYSQLTNEESISSEGNVLIQQQVTTWLFEDGVVIRCEHEKEHSQVSDAGCLPCWIEFRVQEIRTGNVNVSPSLKRFSNRCQIKTWLQFNNETEL